MNHNSSIVGVDDSTRAGSESWMRSLMRKTRERVADALVGVIGEDIDERVRRVTSATEPADPFGFDIEWAKYAMMCAAFLYKRYFRVEVFGVENIPPGRVLLIANHSGQVPIDGAIVAATLFLNTNPPRILRSMVEKWSQTLPVVGMFFSRCGQVVGVPENAERLLRMGEALLVFPEGSRGISKSFAERYQLRDFGLGFMRLALQTDTPIVPIAVVGAEEQYINVGNLDSLARALGMPAFPIIPQLLLPGGLFPLPTKYRVYLGDPLRMKGDPDDEDAVIRAKVDTVKNTIQSMINRGLKERRHLFW